MSIPANYNSNFHMHRREMAVSKSEGDGGRGGGGGHRSGGSGPPVASDHNAMQGFRNHERQKAHHR